MHIKIVSIVIQSLQIYLLMKKNLTFKTLEIVPMTLENKDSQLFKFIFIASKSKMVKFKIGFNFPTIIQIQ